MEGWWTSEVSSSGGWYGRDVKISGSRGCLDS